MVKNYDIKNAEELRGELYRLKTHYKAQELAMVEDAKGIVHTEIDKAKEYLLQFKPSNLINELMQPKNLLNLDSNLNLVGNAVSRALPFILNKTIFRGSSFLTKAIVGIASRKLGRGLNIGDVRSLVTDAKHWLADKVDDMKHKRSRVKFEDYGIPPDSETY